MKAEFGVLLMWFVFGVGMNGPELRCKGCGKSVNVNNPIEAEDMTVLIGWAELHRGCGDMYGAMDDE